VLNLTRNGEKEEFSFNTFMTDAYDDCWKYTPLIELYNHYNTGVPTLLGAVNPAMEEAAKKGGLLLKSVLQEDDRIFITVGKNPNVYTKT
jgi:hypothetical protein